MKPFFILALGSFISFFSFAQTTGKSKIVLKDKTVLSNIKVWNIYSNKIEYEENESLHDLLTARIARIENDTAVLSFDDSGQLFSRPYDWIIKTTDDTVQCIISQLGGNYIYYYPKGRENRSYIPETSVKKYQLFKPEPVQKLEQGSAPFSPQAPAQDSLKKNNSEASVVKDTSSADTIKISAPSSVSDELKPDTSLQKTEKEPEKITKKEMPPSLQLPVQSELCYDSYIKGERDAVRKSEPMWGTGSFCLNGCLCGIPASTLSLIALNSKQKPKKIPEGVDEKCYLLGYQNQQTKKRLYSTAIGGLVSSAVIFSVFYVAIIASQNGW